jgi:hypothetical protein
VVPAGDKPRTGRKRHAHVPGEEPTERETSTRMLYQEAMRRAFGLEILKCPCGGRRVVLAAIKDAVQLERILRQNQGILLTDHPFPFPRRRKR